MRKTIYVNCSFCKGMMEVNAETGEIIDKWEQGQQGEGKDKMSNALKKLEEDKKRRQDLFSVKKDEIEGAKKKLSSAFEKEVKKAKKDGPPDKPFRPFDLD
ncbi:hypothetical protein BVX98_00065 [bacterium F11]|nr:hypothetical protein BVX98_00065 [bacterium F11]